MTVEVVLDLYQAIRAGARERTIVIGCNTIGHLGARRRRVVTGTLRRFSKAG